jgi:hypothetical protein
MRYSLSLVFVLIIAIFSGCSDSSSVDTDQLVTETFDTYASVLSEDFDRLDATGIPMDSTDGIFSIGWNEFFNPMTNDTVTHGHAFAVTFDDVNTQGPRPIKNGIDIGSVFINYQSNHIELQKIVNPFGGVLYSLFPRPINGNVLEFIPNEVYEFEITGSANFGPVNIPLTAPSALMNFTSHTNFDSIDVNNDLLLTWSGGTTADPVAIHILPQMFFQPLLQERIGNFGQGNHGNYNSGFGNGPGFRPGGPGFGPHPLPFPMPIHMGIFEVLSDNPGQYTVAATDLQNLLSNTNATGIICHISQLNAVEVDHEGRVLRAVMRNGDQLMLSVQ